MNEQAVKYLERARELEKEKLCVQSKALLLYQLSGEARGYGTALLDARADINYQAGAGPACTHAADVIKKMAEKVLGYDY